MRQYVANAKYTLISITFLNLYCIQMSRCEYDVAHGYFINKSKAYVSSIEIQFGTLYKFEFEFNKAARIEIFTYR